MQLPARFASLSLIAALQLAACSAFAAPVFVDWTNIDTSTDTAVGTIGVIAVTLEGGQLDGGVTDGSSLFFNQPYFSPALLTSDVVFLRGAQPSFNYVLTFSSPIANPLIHLASFASTLTFAPGTSISELSDDGGISVVGNLVSGVTIGSTDANGTLRLNGTFSSIAFSAAYPIAPGDGIALQVGADFANSVPEPSTLALSAASIFLLGLARRGSMSRHH